MPPQFDNPEPTPTPGATPGMPPEKGDSDSSQPGNQPGGITADQVLDYPPAPPSNPVNNLFAARILKRGLEGTLFATNGAIESTLANSGSVGTQLLDRLDLMQARGWSWGPQLPIGDPYLTASTPNPIARLGRYFAIGGTNVNEFNGIPLRRITYNNISHMLGNSFMAHGNASPLTRVTSTVAHEIGHYDGIPLDYLPDELSHPQQRILAARLLETETNAVLTQLHITDVNKAFHPDVELFRPGLIDGTFGSRLRANWTNPGAPPMYKTLNLLTPAEADAVVNSHILNNYGGVIDAKGRVGSFDLASVYGKYSGELPKDAEILAKVGKYTEGTKPPKVSFLGEWGQTRSGKWFGRGLQGLAAAGIAYQLLDVTEAFQVSTGTGVGRMGRIGTQYLGGEIGSVVGSEIGMKLALTALGRGKLGMLVVPLSTIFGSMTGAVAADQIVGVDLENFIRTSIDGQRGS